jgi:hypothetical protein
LEITVTERELREIKRRFRPERSNIPKIVGCFVNSNKEIVYRISQSLGMGDPAVSEKLLSTMKKTLSGSLGTNLTEIDFSTKEVSEGEEHKLLMRLKDSRLEDKDALESFYRRAIEGIKIEGNFVILLASDVYDVPTRSKDGESEESYTQFTYMIAAVCPLKEPVEALTFRESDTQFHYADAAALLASPEIGFMFPAFDDRCANIYNLLFYSKSIAESHTEFTESVFKKSAPTPPKAQKESFSGMLTTVLGDECDLTLLKSVHTQIEELIEAHKESRDPEPLSITKPVAKTLLANCGVGEEKLEQFGEAMDQRFGKNAELVPKNIIAHKKFELKMPEVSIKVSPEYKELVTTEKRGDQKYIVIKVTGGVELNGIELGEE